MAIICVRIMLTVLAGGGGIALATMCGMEIKNSIKDGDFYGVFILSICVLMSLMLVMMGVMMALGWII